MLFRAAAECAALCVSEIFVDNKTMEIKGGLGEGVYDFKAFDALVQELLDASPDGFIFLRVDMNPPNWWKKSNPCDVVWDNRRNWVKAGSESWRKLCRRMLNDVIHHGTFGELLGRDPWKNGNLLTLLWYFLR